jgi:hypothetical protein
MFVLELNSKGYNSEHLILAFEFWKTENHIDANKQFLVERFPL